MFKKLAQVVYSSQIACANLNLILMKKQITKWARRCDITGEGMDEGYCIGEGGMYIKYEKDMLKHIEEEGFDSIDEAYECDYYYWTEWECPEDIQYMEIDGKMYEEGEPEFEKHFTHSWNL